MQRRPVARTTPTPRHIDEMIDDRESMLSHPLPVRYSAIETGPEAIEAAIPTLNQRTLRLHIVWDNPASELPLERVLDLMRETGAAMVVKVEEVE